ncbi:hypothetical protein K1719_001989 [Acacia pycnantha]|nr:hypothetical protein K1719_001989 [Acacia pycnantha]
MLPKAEGRCCKITLKATGQQQSHKRRTTSLDDLWTIEGHALLKVGTINYYHMGGIVVLTLIEALLIMLALLISKAIRFISPSVYGDQLVVEDSTKDDVILTQTAPPPSSPIVFSPPATKYDVFLSFRGEDTRHTFASYLYEGLCKANIHTFMDNELCKGESISQVLLRTIEESEISMIIFSENYASSTWCLDELVHILECKEKFGRVVIPIFYNIDPSNIRKQNGSFGNGLDKLKKRFEDNPEKSQKWINALGKAANLSGWDSKNTRPESKFVEEIVKDALRKLKYNSSYLLEGLIGIAHHIRNIENLLREARIVGIWGMGGAGKTTLAKAIFQELRAQFNASSFIENVKEELKKIGLNKLQQNCLKELIGMEIRVCDLKSSFVKNRLGRKKILLILDDVVDLEIAEDLTKLIDWFGEGSRIVITSRDRQVLRNASASSTYHVPNLDFDNSLHLFSLKAFHQHQPSEGYMDLSRSVVEYCQGNPLALVVLGRFLYVRKEKAWKSALDKLKKDPPKNVVDVLKLSFDGLDENQQNVFLDLAFLINERVDISLNITRQLYGSSAYIDICVLEEKSLISFNNRCLIAMHDLLKKMGLEIARNQLTSDAPIRLWRHEDIADFFNRGKGIEAIRCLSLDVSMMRSIISISSIFEKMHNLIYLKVYKSDQREPPILNICGVVDHLSEALRFLIWEEYPLPYVPLHFCAENLVTLIMRNGKVQQLWEGNQHFPNLDKIDLSHSEYLTALPDLSQAPKIKSLWLDGCVNLAQIHSSSSPGEGVLIGINRCGPMQIKVGGSIKERSSELVIVDNSLDLLDGLYEKVRTKIFVCGNKVCGFRVKYEVVSLEEKKELIKGTKRLTSLLPFLREFKCFEGPIYRYSPNYLFFSVVVKDERGDSGREMMNGHQPVTIPLMKDDDGHFVFTIVVKEKRSDSGEMVNRHQVVTMPLMEDDEEDHVLMDDCYCKSFIFTRVPNSITRWSLLVKLTLKSLPLSNEYCRRNKPRLEVTLTFTDLTLPIPSEPLLICYDGNMDFIKNVMM